VVLFHHLVVISRLFAICLSPCNTCLPAARTKHGQAEGLWGCTTRRLPLLAAKR
jgi:hypothetical protein